MWMEVAHFASGLFVGWWLATLAGIVKMARQSDGSGESDGPAERTEVRDGD